jgi:hypothetical protein
MNKPTSENLNRRSLLNGIGAVAFLTLAVLIAACNNAEKGLPPMAVYQAALEAGKKGDGYRRGYSLKPHSSSATKRQRPEAKPWSNSTIG